MSKPNSYYLKWSTFFSALTLYTPIVPLYFLAQGISLTTVVLSQTFYSAMIILMEVPTGALADRFGHRKSVVLSGLIGPLGLLTVLAMPTTFGMFLSYLFFGLSEALESGSKEALLFEDTKHRGERRNFQKHLSHVLSFDTLAFALGTAIVGVTYGLFGSDAFAPLIWATALTKFTSFLITLRLHDVPNLDNDFAGNNMWKLFRQSVKHIRQNQGLRNITYVKLLTIPAIYVLYSSYQSYFETNNVSPYWIGFVLTFGALANTLALRNAHRLERIWSLDKAVLYLNLLLALTHIVFSLVSAPWLLVVTYILLQAQYNLQEPIISDYVNERISSNMRATVLSGISLIRQIGNVMSKFFLALALTPFGVTGMLRIQASYLVIGALLSYWLLIRCGCTYKISHSDSGEIVSLETQSLEQK
jgi:MFS family permease